MKSKGKDQTAPPRLGRYEIRGELGRGIMGVVYRGHDPVIDRPVALKTIIVADALPPKKRAAFLDRFALEARIAGKLIHPNIVITYDAAMDENSGTPFIAMELVEGESLSICLDRQGLLPWKEALDIVIPLARALDYAHQNGVVHRDVKPANILITSDGVPKITDFGIAKLPTGDITSKGVILGTPQFMSPEQLRGDALDGRSDLFCLGAVLYNLLVGTSPFEADEVGAIFHQVVCHDPTPPSQMVPETPPALDDVLARVLAKSASDRYPTGTALAEDLATIELDENPAGAKLLEQVTPLPEHHSLSLPTVESSTTCETVDEASAAKGTQKKRRMLLRFAFIAATLAAVSIFFVATIGPDRVLQQARPALDSLSKVSSRVIQQVAEFRSAIHGKRNEKARLAELISQAELLLQQGESFENRGYWDQALDAYENALALHRQTENGTGEAAALLASGRLKATQANWAKAGADLDAAATVFRVYDQPAGEVESLVLRGNIERDQGNASRADQLYQDSMATAEELDDRRPWCGALLARATHHLLQGQWQAAQEDLETVQRMSAPLVKTNPSEIEISASTSVLAAAMSFALDHSDEANTWWAEARKACQKGTDPDCLAKVELWQGRATLGVLNLAESRAHFKKAERHFRSIDHLPGLTAALENLQELEQLNNNLVLAQKNQQEATVLRQRLGLPVLAHAFPLADELTLEGDSEPNLLLEENAPPLKRLLFLFQAAPRTAASEKRRALLERALSLSEDS
ncbi:MAG: protein kinase [bacterium]|nr:protein kinase [bacterium]